MPQPMHNVEFDVETARRAGVIDRSKTAKKGRPTVHKPSKTEAYYCFRKADNTRRFNAMAKKRRKKAKFNARARKRNR